jgi:chemotaxis protein CheX
MDSNGWRQLSSIVVETTTRLFDMLGLKVEYQGSPDPIPCADELIVAVIGFAGSQMRGSVVLASTSQALRLTHPLGKEADDEGLRDWAGELANQLIGRIKIRLLAHQMVIQLGTPTTISGRELTLGAALKNAECLPHRFTAGSEWLLVRMEGVAEPGVQMLASPVQLTATDEGELLLF